MKRGLLVLGLVVSAGACGDGINNAQLNPSTDKAHTGTVHLSTEQVTVEEGGTAQFDVSITEPPEGGNVTVTITSADETAITATPTLTFSEGNTKQTVMISTNDDDVVGGSAIVKLAVAATGAGNYENISTQTVTVTLRDDERTGGVAEPQSLVLDEGASGTFTLALDGPPTGDVTVTPNFDETELTVAPATLTFSATDHATPQTFTVTAVNDGEEEEEEFKVISLSASGGDYDGADLPEIGVQIGGNAGGGDGVTVNPTAVMTSEDGTTATFDVTLDMVPAEGVTLTATSGMPSEGTVSGPVTVTTASPTATFTVTGVDDADVDGPQTYQVTVAAVSENVMYNGLSIPSVAVTNADNDGATIDVSPTSVTLEENPPGMATITVTLNSDPGETVTITQSGPSDRVMVQPNALVFTSANYATPQTFTLTAIDNAMATGDQTETLDLSVSATGTYASYPITDVTMTLVDDDD